MNIKKRIPLFVVGLGVLLFYLLFPELQLIPFKLLNIDINKLPMYIRIMYSIFFELIMVVTIILVFKDQLKKDWADLKVNHKEYFNTYFKYWILAIVLMMASNAIISIFTKNIPANEDLIRKIFAVSPIYIYITAVIFAPIMEELVFRLGFRYMFKTDWLFILLSGLAFGSMHVIGSTDILKELVYIIPYSIPGWIFAYVLVKSKNSFVPMGLHFLHNGILLTLQFLVLIFK